MTKMHIEIELQYPPTGNTATRHTKTGIHYKTDKAKAYRFAIAQTLLGLGVGANSGRKPLAGPLAVSWLIAPPDRRSRDVDNFRKECADALTLGGLWVDDSNKVIRRESFEWTEPAPNGRVLLVVEVL